MKTFYRIYKITNILNNKCYVGVTTQQLLKRFYQHCTTNDCTHLHNSIKKHGKNNFKIEEIYNANTLQDMLEMEIYFIRYYNSLSPNGYNLREGGKYGTFAPIIIEDMKRRMKSKWKNKDDMKYALDSLEKIRKKREKSVIGINIKTGKELLYQNINIAMKNNYYPGRVLSGNALYDHDYTWFYYDLTKSVEHYKQLAKQKLGGFGNYTKGKNCWTDENRENRIKAMKNGSKHRFKPIIQVDLETKEQKEFQNVNDAVRAGFSTSQIYNSLKHNKHNKYMWLYK